MEKAENLYRQYRAAAVHLRLIGRAAAGVNAAGKDAQSYVAVVFGEIYPQS